MEIGVAKGLAQDFQYDQRINDLRYQKQQSDRASALNEAKAKLYADDLDFMNAANSYDNPRIKDFAKKQVGVIGKFASDNPGWEGNVQLRGQMNLLKRELKDNPDLQRGMASDAAFKQLNEDLAEVAKNPEQHDIGAYDALMAQKDNYVRFGNQDGEDAARVHGAQAFVYRKPKNFIDLNKEFAAVGNDFRDMKREVGKGGRNAYQEYSNPESLKVIANQMYSQNKTQIDREAAKTGLDPIVYTMKGIDAHVKKVQDYGDYNLSDAMTMRAMAKRDAGGAEKEASGPTTWDKEIKGKPMGMENGETMMKVIGPPPNVTLKDNQGNPIDLSDIDFKYTGNHRYVEVPVLDNNGKTVKQRQKIFEVYTMVPKDISDNLGITKDSWFGDDEISNNFADNKNISRVPRQTKDGKTENFTKIKTWVPVDVNNEGFRQRYDAENLPSKLRQGVEVQEQPKQQRQVYSVADLRKDARWTEADIQRAVNEGLAK